MEQVCIVGLGYIGLPTALMFASHGVEVHGVDVSQHICDTINAGGIHIVEPGLADVAKKVAELGTFKAGTKAIRCKNFIISVPTPITEEKKADLSYVRTAGEEVASVLKRGDLVILESTVPPRCTEDVLVPILEERTHLVAGRDFLVAHCPERVLPGKILYELENNNKIIGGLTPESAQAASDLYGAFVKGEMIKTDATTAEMCKLMENTFRDVNIALANELAILCENLGINAWEVIELANKHPRVNLHQPGPGVGGHCLAVDPWFIVDALPDDALMIALARDTNDSMPLYVADWVADLAEAPAKIAILGCTYKPDIDDMRESPVTALIAELESNGYTVSVCDPYIEKYNCQPEFAAKDADVLVLCVNHSAFKSLPLARLAKVMREPVLLDTRNFISAEDAEDAGFEYHLLGRGEAID